MKKQKLILVLLIIVAFLPVNAQFIKNTGKKAPRNWQNLSFETDTIYGAEVNKAYDFLKDKAPKKKVIVALIGTGVDIEHEDLANSIWTNPKEKSDNKDNDKNGYVDDLHGWNFLGNKKGEVLDKISREGDREFMRMKDKDNYSALQFDGKNYVVFDTLKQKFKIIKPPKDLAEYKYFRNDVILESPLGGAYLGYFATYYVPYYANLIDKKIQEKYKGKTQVEIPADAYKEVIDKNSTDSLYKVSLNLIAYTAGFGHYKNWESLKKMVITMPKVNLDGYTKKITKTLYDERKLVGDNYMDIKDKKYGNNVLMTENAGLGTMFAGLICAGRNNTGLDGVANNVQLMVLRVEADEVGEPYMKDQALAIRYAVDHGADIIQMTKTNTFYPVKQSEWLNEALEYAEKKGVLVVLAMEDFSCKMEDIQFYPCQKISSTKTLNNILTVAASDILGNPLINANYSKTQLDIFAPGKDLYTTYTGNTYRTGTSSRMAASVATGVAALIKAYYPTLSGEQIRKLMMENVTSRAGAEVEKEYRTYKKNMRKTFRSSKSTKDIILFDELSSSNGIVNAYKAVQAAEQLK